MGESTAPPVWSTEGRAIALRRPARKQMDGPAPQERDRGAGGGEFNVWCARAACCEPRGVRRSARRELGCCAALMRALLRRYGKYPTNRESRDGPGCVIARVRRSALAAVCAAAAQP